MEFTAIQIAALLNGTIEGDPDIKVSTLSKIDESLPDSLTFLTNPKYNSYIYSTKASIVLVNQDFIVTQAIGATLIRVENAYASFARLLEMFSKSKNDQIGISAKASISSSATLGTGVSVGDFTYISDRVSIGDNVHIHPQVYIGPHVTIDENTLIYPGVKIYSDCIIGKNCILHSGVVIGSDGFGFAPQPDNNYQKIPQLGNVVLEENVEVGSNTTIDRATLGSTIIHQGVKLDNLIQVAHNVEIGENTVIAAQTGISGSTRIGKNCMIGGQVGIVGHIIIADNVKIGAGSGVERSILQEGAAMLGAPAIEAGKARRNFIHWRKLDEIVRKVYTIEKQVNKSHE
ncbi:MAG: UDP-3-O-(3-hydroxymyristoyl)glucosamine N-acyltransferase [Bacteroidales bacterium]|jgi:UDP-3-O-[3-hydroxymyristoyl] glucosamine N-acyltransferase|nr:UDP-3-O-(3-hydroxymyristoyl)glucosamine N-acyltransferase [Bacteroidales bacterium]